MSKRWHGLQELHGAVIGLPRRVEWLPSREKLEERLGAVSEGGVNGPRALRRRPASEGRRSPGHVSALLGHGYQSRAITERHITAKPQALRPAADAVAGEVAGLMGRNRDAASSRGAGTSRVMYTKASFTHHG